MLCDKHRLDYDKEKRTITRQLRIQDSRFAFRIQDLISGFNIPILTPIIQFLLDFDLFP